ncbi:TRAPP complex subunit Trs23 [Schizosaccharomyces japonicus yFS275]|uniref:Trafficking protein particle complex subunit n=1 Tax=Schizosaccharomyces japonicus (strain yFS275 / FY16936) TaxID=402676 RepID=B6K5P5_SCHJY|nr:TRAPP complex subunit Trs23 [Schizosaccharomyces japonicus yFS275]EEB08849.1 TRAPP complex subunit Trs23 [Schizosaccharomyces japonicus yFS275]
MLTLLIINRAGSLIYHNNFASAPVPLSQNDFLVLAGTIHGVHAISTQMSPLPQSSGIQTLESKSFNMHIRQTHTGLKFIMFCNKKITNAQQMLNKAYELYADYALKNPFYTLEMPIRCQLFEEQLKRYINSY